MVSSLQKLILGTSIAALPLLGTAQQSTDNQIINGESSLIFDAPYSEKSERVLDLYFPAKYREPLLALKKTQQDTTPLTREIYHKNGMYILMYLEKGTYTRGIGFLFSPKKEQYYYSYVDIYLDGEIDQGKKICIYHDTREPELQYKKDDGRYLFTQELFQKEYESHVDILLKYALIGK